MDTPEAKTFLRDFYEKRKLNDPAAVSHFFVEGASYSIAGHAREDSIASEVSGAVAFKETLSRLLREWNWIEVDFKAVLAEGDVVIARYFLTVEHVPTGTTLTTDIVDFIEMQDGKIANMRQFVDTAHLSDIALRTPRKTTPP